MKTRILIIFLLTMAVEIVCAQSHKVDVEGNGFETIRVLSTGPFAQAGLELTLDNGGLSAADWRMVNSLGKLRFNSSLTNFNSVGTNRMTLTKEGHLGLGTEEPETTLHLAVGSEASNTNDGYLVVGQKDGVNIVVDNNEINSRTDGLASTLYLQREGGNLIVGSNGGSSYLSHGGGNTYTGFNGGNTFLGYGGGHVGIGTTLGNGRLNVADDLYQLYLRNAANGVNDWYIGASSDGWVVGDNLLIFSPTSSSSNSKFRLRDTGDNNGSTAPVEIVTGSQKLLIDGNEIDANSSLYINHNTDENTYINPTGGRVAVASSSPWGMLHVKNTDINDHCLTLEGTYGEWAINPSNTHTNENLFFVPAGNGISAVSGIDANTGSYLTFSDRRLKENIRTLPSVREKISQLGFYTYQLKHDPKKRSNIGVMAQEIQEVFPELMGEGENFLAVAYGPMAAIALKAIQELDAENKVLKQTILDQSARLEAIEQFIKRIDETQGR